MMIQSVIKIDVQELMKNMLLDLVILDITHMLLKRKYTYKSSVYLRVSFTPGTWETCERCPHSVMRMFNYIARPFCTFNEICCSLDITNKFHLKYFRYVPG